ncbi:putative protein OS=Ureibacillus acetophenoni OX=614649 GN=SAMN05877842_103162 PE=4 SV=1 [Ureibacillus acetophenoni]
MLSTNSFHEMLVTQARNILTTMKDLKWIAGKKGRDRGALIERFTANTHSFNVYTYANEGVKNSKEIQTFKENIVLYSNEFNVARFDFDGEVDEERVQALYEEVLTAYNDMVIALGYDKEIVNPSRF